MGKEFHVSNIVDLCDLMCPAPPGYTVIYDEEYDEWHVYFDDTLVNVFKDEEAAYDWMAMMEE